MDPLEWILQFIDQISAPAKVMTASVRGLTQALTALQAVSNKVKLPAIPGLPGGGAGAAAQAAKQTAVVSKTFANMWNKIGAQMQKQQQAALQTAQPGVSAAFSNMWQRIGLKMMADQTKAMRQAAAAAQREAEKASHKSYFGGHKSLGGLFGARADHKISGMATGAADAILGAPGRIIGGGLGLMSSGISSLVEGTAGMAFNIGKAAVSAQAMREDSVVALTQLFHSSDKANELFDVARQAAKETKLDTEDMIKYYTTLSRSFNADEVKNLAWTVADIESVRAGKGELFTRAIGKLKGGGPKAGFGAFQSAVSLGPEWTNVLPVLSQMLGKKSTLSRIDVQKMMRKGEIGTDVAIQSIVTATNKLLNTETGQAGEFAKKTGGATWSGVISNIKNAMVDVLNMQLPTDHPIYKFKDLLKAMGAKNGLLDSMSERGRAFEKIISDIVADVFRLIGMDTGEINNTMDAILTIGKAAQQTFSKFVDYIRSEVFPAVSTALNEINSAGVEAALGKLAARIAWVIAKGISMGINDAIENNLPSWLRGNLQDRISPPTGKSGTVAARGGGVELGGALPHFATSGVVPGPYGKPRLVIAEGGEEFMGFGAGKRGREMPAINLSMPLQIHGNLSMDESDILRAVEQGGAQLALKLQEIIAAAQGAQR